MYSMDGIADASEGLGLIGVSHHLYLVEVVLGINRYVDSLNSDRYHKFKSLAELGNLCILLDFRR